MRTLIFKCPQCQGYTLQAHCPQCIEPTVSPLPARFSPEDRYGQYRRELKRRVNQEQSE